MRALIVVRLPEGNSEETKRRTFRLKLVHPRSGLKSEERFGGPATTQAPASALDVPHCLINIIGIRRRGGRLPRRKNIDGGTLHDS